MNFSRNDGEALQVINVQLNKWNSGDSGSFTFNIGVYFDRVARLLPAWLPMPANPEEPRCLLRVRVGQLMPAHKDHWWKVTPETNIEEVSVELVTVWKNCIAPWLEEFKTVSSLTREPKRGHGWPQHMLTRPAAHLALGEAARASELIEEKIRQIREDSSSASSLKETWIAMCEKWIEDRGLTNTGRVAQT